MENPMTDNQLRSILKMILEIVKSSETIADAVAKIEKLIEE